jgi:hypothetical protein
VDGGVLAGLPYGEPRDFGVLRFTRAIAGYLGNLGMSPSIRSD